jgi:membrane-bound lytic murein transglycosylase D
MNIKNIIYTFSLFVSFSLSAQMETDTVISVIPNPQQAILDSIKNLPKISVLDSIKKTFVSHKEIASMDNLWMKELSNVDLSDLQFKDIENFNPDESVVYDLPTDVLKERLKLLDAKSPFNIEYNIGLENVIKSLLKGRKKSYERLMGIAEYYFPLFEESLAKYNIPIEVKYLAIVESALNPKAKSRVGALGLWQFMYGTGLQYKLDIDSYVDERMDPMKATEAACKYLSGMYTIFGDWDLVLASYNCGPGNVTKAIRRSGGLKNYWNIRKNLPRETAGYLPMFLATMYIFEYHKEHGINPQKAPVKFFATDTLMVKNQLSFDQISRLIDIPVTELQFLNPSYKLNVIPFVARQKNYIRLPKDKSAVFASNEDKIYFFANYEANLREKPILQVAKVRDTTAYNYSTESKWVTRTKSYRVKKGDNLAEIAIKFGVSSNDIKKWNRLRSNNVSKGRNLRITITEKVNVRFKTKVDPAEKIISTKPTESIVAVDPTARKIETVVKPVEIITAQPTISKKEVAFLTEKVISYKDVTKYYKVKKGDNLAEIANRYGVTMSEVKKWNRLKSDNVRKGKNLKIITNEKVVTTVRKKVKKEVDEVATPIAITEIKPKKIETNDTIAKLTLDYIVAKGDNVWNICKKFNISLAQLKEWNNFEGESLLLGTKIFIANPKGETASKNTDYIVAKGENFWTICKKFNITALELKTWNDLKENKVVVGSKIIVSEDSYNNVVVEKTAKPKKESKKLAELKKKAQLYLVKKGDTLSSISKKYPGVTVADLKKWNDIRNGDIKPGMKLKING